MAILASDDYAGLGTSAPTGRTLNNAGGGTETWTWAGTAMFGDGAGALKGNNSGDASLVSAPGTFKHRVRVNPNGQTNNLCVWANRALANGDNCVILLLAANHTSLRASSFTSGSRTDHATTGITAPGTTFWMELEISGLVLTCRILNNDLSVRNTVSHTFGGALPSGGDYWGFGFFQDGNAALFDDPVFDDGASGDTTAPVLTTAVGTATGSTTATVGATTDEANGTMYVVVTTSATQPSVAQIKAGQNNGGTAAAYASSQSITTTGAKTFSATGLTASTTYYAHLVHTDTATNDSNRITSSSFTTTTPDTTAPTLSSGVGTVKSNALIVVGATTNEANGTMYVVVTTSATAPSAAQVKAGQNNGGTAAVFAANQTISSTGAKTFNATGLMQLTGYYPYIVHTDASGNDSSVLSIGLKTTFRNGATAQYIIDNTAATGGNPAGTLYALALTKSADDWMAYRTISGPTPGTGTLTEYADGRFTYVGPDAALWVIQPEVNGVDDAGGQITVELYDQASDVTPPTLTTATGTKTGATTATGTVTTSEGLGTLYYLTNTSPTALSAAVLAGSTQTVTASGVQNISRTGLTAATTYYHHFLHKDPAGNDSAVLSSNSFTTDAVADVTAPTLTSPTAVTLGPNGSANSVTTNEANGTLYWLTNTSATATDAAIKAANSQAVTATGVQNTTSSGLTASTVYYTHFLHRDAAGNDSSRSTSASFTTAAPGGGSTYGSGGKLMRPAMFNALRYPFDMRGGSPQFSPASLFAANEPGAWYDPSDMQTLFQDSAGTVPVTAVEQPVGRILDKSGRGNHATQSTAASRPVLSARVNQYLATETLSTQNVTTVATGYTLRFEGAGSITLTGTAIGVYTAGTYSITCTAGTLTSTVLGSVTKADLRASSDGVGIPSYQRVNTATDYDSTGFPLYLRFDGVDDGLVTSTITPGTDKAQVFAGVRKLSDAATAMLLELSAATDTNNGTLHVAQLSGPSRWQFISKGSGASASIANASAAPISSVLTGIGDISNDLSTLRIDGTQAAQATTDQGTGNYLAYPLYIGRRGGTSLPFNGRLYSLAVRFGPNLTAEQITQTETWVNGKTLAF